MEVDKTFMRGIKLCKNIWFDANALYLWAIMQKMPVGQYKHISEYNIKDLIHDALNDKLFGFVEVGIKVPEELYDNFQRCHQYLKILLLMQQMKILLVVTCLIIVNKFHYIKGKN